MIVSRPSAARSRSFWQEPHGIRRCAPHAHLCGMAATGGGSLPSQMASASLVSILFTL
jgi:hypothetical protein